MASVLPIEKVREFISDYPEENLLLDKQEFTDTFMELSMELAVSEYNSLSPKSGFTEETFPSKSILMLGTLWQMYTGKVALMARNHMSYSDGGLQIPIEEKFELYRNLADSYGTQFMTAASRLKGSMNMENGWGEVRSDEAMFPIW